MNEKTMYNQCQDCGCSGSKLKLRVHRDKDIPEFSIFCPYCKRETRAIPVTDIFENQNLLADTWNEMNREYKEGLA